MTWDGPVAGISGARIVSVPLLPDSLPGAERAGLYAQAAPGLLLQSVPGVARFLARGGTTIEVAAEDGADPRAVRLFLDGIMRAALVYQRGEMPLHAASLVEPKRGEAVAICGPSGIGKSTLAAELCRRGWLLLADDNTRVTCEGSQALAWPGNDMVKLWRDACETNELDPGELQRVRPELEKYFLPVPVRSEPSPLWAVVELTMGGDPDLREVDGAARLALLSSNGYRPRLVGPLDCATAHLRIVANIARSARVFRLGHARAATAPELADRIVAVLP